MARLSIMEEGRAVAAQPGRSTGAAVCLQRQRPHSLHSFFSSLSLPSSLFSLPSLMCVCVCAAQVARFCLFHCAPLREFLPDDAGERVLQCWAADASILPAEISESTSLRNEGWKFFFFYKWGKRLHCGRSSLFFSTSFFISICKGLFRIYASPGRIPSIPAMQCNFLG